MKSIRSTAIFAAATASLLALALVAPTQAQDLYWSVGLSSPGIQVGVSSGRQVLVQPVYQPHFRVAPPLVVLPRPVFHVRPAPLAYAQPTPGFYARPGPVVLVPAPVLRTEWRHPGRHHGWQHRREMWEAPPEQHQGQRQGYGQAGRRS